MNKIEINDEFLEKPFLSYDASVILFDSIRNNDSEMNDEEKSILYDIIEWSTGNFITYIKNWSQHPDFFESNLYKHIYVVFSILLSQNFVSKRNIYNICKLSNINFPPPKVDSEILDVIKEKVLSHVNLYLDDDNDWKENLMNKAICYNIIWEQDKVLDTLINPINKKPNNPNSYEDMIGYLLGYWKYDEAIPYLEKIIKLKPSNLICYQELIGIYMDKWDYDSIIKLCLKYDVENKWQNPLYIILWDAYFDAWRYQDALDVYISSEINEYILKRLKKLWDYLNHSKNFSIAKKVYKEIIRIYPDYYYPYNQIGTMFFELDEYEEALVFFKKALEVEKYTETIYSNLAFTYLYLWDNSKALFYINKASSFHKENYSKFRDIVESRLLVWSIIKNSTASIKKT